MIDAHEHTLQVCRACAETTRDLAWEVKRGHAADGRVAGRDARRSRACARRHRQGRSRDCGDEGGALVSGVPSADRLGELVNFSVDAIVLVNADGVIKWANPATEDVLGYRADDIVGVHVRDLVEPVDRDAWQTLVAGLFDDPSSAGPRHVPLPPQGRIGTLDRRRGAQPPAGTAGRRHRRLLPRRHVSQGDGTAAEGDRGPLRPPRVVRGRRDLRSGRGRILSLRQPADPEAFRVRA